MRASFLSTRAFSLATTRHAPNVAATANRSRLRYKSEAFRAAFLAFAYARRVSLAHPKNAARYLCDRVITPTRSHAVRTRHTLRIVFVNCVNAARV